MASKKCNIENLPTGSDRVHPALTSPIVLTMIFGHLPVWDLRHATTVCRLWKLTASHPSLWRNCKFTINHQSLNVKDSLAQRRIQHVSIIKNKVNVNLVAQSFPTMINLELHSSDLSDISWQELSRLTGLELRSCIGFTGQSWWRQTTCLNNLVTLTLYGDQQKDALTNDSLKAIAANLGKLKYLSLEFCSKITDAGIRHLTGIDGTTHPNLVALTLSFCNSLTGEVLRYLGAGQKQLKQLKLECSDFVTHAGLQHVLAMNCLTSLYLKGCPDVDNDCMQLVAKLPTLQFLELNRSKVGDIGLEFLASGNSKVAKLFLINCSNVTDIGLKSLAKLSSLWNLSMEYCSGITDQGIVYLSQGQARIHHLNVRKCILTTNTTLLLISENLQDLRVLHLDQVSNDGLVSAAHNLRWLHTLLVDRRNVIDRIHKLWTPTDVTA